MFRTSAGARQDVQNFILLITAGQSNNHTLTLVSAAQSLFAIICKNCYLLILSDYADAATAVELSLNTVHQKSEEINFGSAENAGYENYRILQNRFFLR